MKRGARPKENVSIAWSPDFAYAIGLIVADGCVSKDGRHINFTSKDKELIMHFCTSLRLKLQVKEKKSGAGKVSYYVQFSDVSFHKYLSTIGVYPAKSLTISGVNIPKKYFIDFFRGYFDGDGSVYSYRDTIYENSSRLYISFTSGSVQYIDWLRDSLSKFYGVRGYISKNKNNKYVQLKFAKRESLLLCDLMYYKKDVLALSRKYKKAMSAIKNIKSRSGEIGRRATFRA